jgi:hypothetical protein
MSINSYRKNVETGVVGPFAPVCYPAAIEQISRFGYTAEVYQAYIDYVAIADKWDEKQRQENVYIFEDIMESLVKPLGGLEFDDVVFKTIVTVNGLRRDYHSLMRDGYNIVVEIACTPKDPVPHGVGIIPIEGDYITLVSTHVPKKLQGVVHIDKVGACLYNHMDKRMPDHPYHTANLTALPNV